jgi:hypothetical protein
MRATRARLDDPRAVEILTTEHWSLLSTRSLGLDEMLGRATMLISIVSAIVVALALLAQAMQFGRTTLSLALLLLAVALFLGVSTFARSVVLSFEDARCVAGMDLLRRGYADIVPGLEPYFLAPDRRGLAHGSPQRLPNLVRSLTTISSVIAALNSTVAGALAADLTALLDARPAVFATIGAAVSLVSAALHVQYAARFRRRHAPDPSH